MYTIQKMKRIACTRNRMQVTNKLILLKITECVHRSQIKTVEHVLKGYALLHTICLLHKTYVTVIA